MPEYSEELFEELDELSGKDPRSKTIAGFIAALEIFARHIPAGMAESYFCQAEHDELYIHVDWEQLPPDSEDGRELYRLGFMAEQDTETWGYFT